VPFEENFFCFFFVAGTTQIFFLLFFLLFTLFFVNMLIAVAVRTLSDMSSSQLQDFQVTALTFFKGQAKKMDVSISFI
jgi:hypothetical protein